MADDHGGDSDGHRNGGLDVPLLLAIVVFVAAFMILGIIFLGGGHPVCGAGQDKGPC